MIAVSNTSPLILLDKAGHLLIIGKLFKKVFIPPSVNAEWLRPGGYIVPEWLSVEQLSKDAQNTANGLYQKLDKGESEAIALFSSLNANYLLLDDLNGRRLATSKGFPVVGTLGILVAAKQKGIIPKIAPILDELKKHRFYINTKVRSYI